MTAVLDPYRSDVQEWLRSLGLGGVILPGSLAYDTYPQSAAPTALTAGGSANTDGVWADVITNALAPATPYTVAHMLVHGDTSNTQFKQLRFSLRKNGEVPARRVVGASNESYEVGSIAITFQSHPQVGFDPLRMPGGVGVQAALAADTASRNGGVYLAVLKREPIIIPELLRFAMSRAQERMPSSTAAGTGVTSGGSAWTDGSWVELTSGLSVPAILTGVTVFSNALAHGQLTLGTGAASSEVPWAKLPYTQTLSGSGSLNTTVFVPLQARLLLPANMRLAVRAMASAGSSFYNVAVHYIPLPLY